MFNRLLILAGAGAGAYIYYYYIDIFKWTNSYYRWFLGCSLCNPSYINKVVSLNDYVYYLDYSYKYKAKDM